MPNPGIRRLGGDLSVGSIFPENRISHPGNLGNDVLHPMGQAMGAMAIEEHEPANSAWGAFI